MERKINISFKQKRHREPLNGHAFDLILVHCSCFHQRAKRNYFASYLFPLINSKTWGATPNGQFSFQHTKMCVAMSESGNIKWKLFPIFLQDLHE
jgi:hypothetical protein